MSDTPLLSSASASSWSIVHSYLLNHSRYTVGYIRSIERVISCTVDCQISLSSENEIWQCTVHDTSGLQLLLLYFTWKLNHQNDKSSVISCFIRTRPSTQNAALHTTLRRVRSNVKTLMLQRSTTIEIVRLNYARISATIVWHTGNPVLFPSLLLVTYLLILQICVSSDKARRL